MRNRNSGYFPKVWKISRSEIENKITSYKSILVESCYFYHFWGFHRISMAKNKIAKSASWGIESKKLILERKIFCGYVALRQANWIPDWCQNASRPFKFIKILMKDFFPSTLKKFSRSPLHDALLKKLFPHQFSIPNKKYRRLLTPPMTPPQDSVF